MKDVQLKHFTVPILESATIDDAFVIIGIAINETTTSNGHKFIAEELRPAAKGMNGIPLLKDHENSVDSIVGKVVSSSFDELEKNIKFKANVNDEQMKELIKRGDLTSVSIGAMVKELEENDDGDLIAKGITIKELSLVAVPADAGATFSTSLSEAYSNNIYIESKKEEDEKMSEEEETKGKEEPKEEPETENVEAKLLKKELTLANKQIAEFEAEKRISLEADYKVLCEKKKVKSIDISALDNSTLGLLKSQVEAMADADEAEAKEEPKKEEKSEPEEETESEEVAEEKMTDNYTQAFVKESNSWEYLGNYPKAQNKRTLSIIG